MTETAVRPDQRQATTDSSPVQIRKLGHVVLYVSDLERSAAFYRDVLGWRQIETPGIQFRAAAFTSGSTSMTMPGPPPYGVSSSWRWRPLA